MTEIGNTAAEVFNPLRPKLIRVAYRMLGSVADAEDVVQEAFLRWLEADRSEAREPEAFLRRIVTRLCLDHLKSARHRRETYPGPWLPEPVVEPVDEFADDVTLPLLMALERLSPLERAAFVLHDVFGLGFDEIAETIGRDSAACRQLASRARTHIRESRPRFPVARDHALEIADAFFAATRSGDIQTLRTLLAEDVVVYTDGGGKVPALLRPVAGAEHVSKLFETLARIFAKQMSRILQRGFINGLPGFVTVEPGDTLQTTALHISGDRISIIYVVRNPEKLEHLRVLVPGAGEQPPA
jgi:RNA polymerase sigma-70 factor (ECF subfamily)